MNTRHRLLHRGTLAAVVATGVVALAALAASPAAAASVIAAPAVSVTTAGTVSSTVGSPLALPALPLLAPAVREATSRVARLGSCSAAMMEL